MTNFQEKVANKTPTIIASNHPNSFFDAIVIAVHYPEPIYFLARGDAFKNKFVAKFLKSLHLIPIYRLSEGKENLSKNNETFEICISLLKQNKTILIFSEGLCVNEWKLRPLKKGTARLALLALKEGVTNLKIIPTNLNYSSFDKNPKEIELDFNAAFEVGIIQTNNEASFYNTFNSNLKNGILKNLLIKEDLLDTNLFKEPNKTSTRFYKILFAIPAFIGFIANFWIYLFFKNFAKSKTKNTVFYDSILFVILLLFYPILVLIIVIILGFIFSVQIGILFFIAMPLSGWFYKMYKSY